MLEFRSLAELLRPAQLPEPQEAPTVQEPAFSKVDEEGRLREVRFFKAHLREALEVALEKLLQEIARVVLARELQLAPSCISSIVEDALVRYRQLEPLRVRVHPQDLDAIDGCGVDVYADALLERGDAVLDLRTGSIDLSLQTRLEEVLGRSLHDRA